MAKPLLGSATYAATAAVASTRLRPKPRRRSSTTSSTRFPACSSCCARRIGASSDCICYASARQRSALTNHQELRPMSPEHNLRCVRERGSMLLCPCGSGASIGRAGCAKGPKPLLDARPSRTSVPSFRRFASPRLVPHTPRCPGASGAGSASARHFEELSLTLDHLQQSDGSNWWRGCVVIVTCCSQLGLGSLAANPRPALADMAE